jgi:hypothetical protein
MSITMVVFDDNTAVGEPVEIEILQGERMMWVQMLSAVVADLRTVKNSPSPKETVDELVLSLSGEASSGDGATPEGVIRLAPPHECTGGQICQGSGDRGKKRK